ncbi:MAG: FMN-binding protein [Candidatus Marinimicrobia bacterium]|nr:FMN-binding protein [Candidatus Neomarinimicrobiota bacterium]MDD5709679.1 FMN-binding protein [Candidatus Neomarinimicrobiota bacterium]
MKRGLIILFVVIGIFALVIAGGILIFGQQAKALFREIETEYAEIEEIDLQKIPDGTYSARFGSIPVFVDVEVYVSAHHIDSIRIIEQSSGPGYGAPEILGRILEKQQPRVDIVTGATISSKCIMVAVKKALIQP